MSEVPRYIIRTSAPSFQHSARLRTFDSTFYDPSHLQLDILGTLPSKLQVPPTPPLPREYGYPPLDILRALSFDSTF